MLTYCKWDVKRHLGECIGTFVLTLLGCGTAMFLECGEPAGVVGTAIAFDLTVVAMAYTIGNISGCHINPARSIGPALFACVWKCLAKEQEVPKRQ